MFLRFLSLAALFLSACASTRGEFLAGYEWRDLGEGIFLHARTDPFDGPVDGSSVVIVNAGEVVVVDTHINPAAARALVANIKSVTSNPVSHIVNTHWHDDHVNGNATLRDAFPGARIVAHPYTLEKLKSEWEAFEASRVEAFAAITVQKILDAADAAEADDPDRAIQLRVYAGYVEALKPELGSMKFAYPDLLVTDRLSLGENDRKIEILWAGEGNTEGDLVVWLPDERALITGDIVVAPAPYAFDSPMREWRATLDRLAAMEPALVIPGHGAPMRGDAYIRQLDALLGATLGAVKQARDAGATFNEVAERVDLSEQRKLFVGDDPRAVNAWTHYYLTPGVKSAWRSLGYPSEDGE